MASARVLIQSVRRWRRPSAICRRSSPWPGPCPWRASQCSSIYVERRGALYRWSPAHRGGPYPLLRITAKFLQMDHHGLLVPCRPLDGESKAGFGPDGIWEGVCIVGTKEDESDPPDAWALLEFDGVMPAPEVEARITDALADRDGLPGWNAPHGG